MTMLVLERRVILKLFCWMFLLVVGFYAAYHWSGIKRDLYGVKRGVTLDGQDMGGFLPEEVKRIVTKKAEFYALAPRDAGFFLETGELVPEKAGRGVDTEATIQRVLKASPGEQVPMITYSIPAVVSKEYFIPVYQGETSSKKVSVTINVDWGQEVIPQLLSVLNKNGVKATFFITGGWTAKFPELARAISMAGHEIANHGLHHGHPNQMSKDELTRLVVENHRLLEEATGRSPAKLFAPPYGEYNEKVLSVVGGLGYRTILWTIDTVDWKLPAPEVIFHRVTERIKPGAIILMHPTAPTVAILGEIIQTLRGQGYDFITVSELLAKKD